MHPKTIIPTATALSLAPLAAAQRAADIKGIQGFNSGAFKLDNSAKVQADFEKEMRLAQKLHNSPGTFNSVRLYTNVQWTTEDTPIEAFNAALATNTSLLLGIWCSETDSIAKELKALTTALEQKGKPLADLVLGISVGSEDLYRSSEKGIRNDAGVGAGPDTIVGFIDDTRAALRGSLLADKPVGHVDAWTAWRNASNRAVLEAVDFVGADMYVYYEDENGNSPDNTTNVWSYIHGEAAAAARHAGVPLWITETGHPTKGEAWGEAVASVENAGSYWQDIGCGLFGRENVWWYQLEDSDPGIDQSFAIADGEGTPKFDLACPSGAGAPAPVNTSPAAGLRGDGLILAAAITTAVGSLAL